jgi:hypothetical protein
MGPEKGKASSASGPTASASSALEYDLEKIGGPKGRRQGGKGSIRGSAIQYFLGRAGDLSAAKGHHDIAVHTGKGKRGGENGSKSNETTEKSRTDATRRCHESLLYRIVLLGK